jgi:hypothetical protein
MAVGTQTKSVEANHNSASGGQFIIEKDCNPGGVGDLFDEPFSITMDLEFFGLEGGPMPAGGLVQQDFSVVLDCGDFETFTFGDPEIDDMFDFFTTYVCQFNNNTPPCWNEGTLQIVESNPGANVTVTFDPDDDSANNPDINDWCQNDTVNGTSALIDIANDPDSDTPPHALWDAWGSDGLGCQVNNNLSGTMAFDKVCTPLDDDQFADVEPFTVAFDVSLDNEDGSFPAAPPEAADPTAASLDFEFEINCGESVSFGPDSPEMMAIVDFFNTYVCAGDMPAVGAPCWEEMTGVICEFPAGPPGDPCSAVDMPEGMLDRYDGNQEQGLEWCDGGPFGSEEFNLGLLIDDTTITDPGNEDSFFEEGLGCQIENFFAQCVDAGCEGLITIHKDCAWADPDGLGGLPAPSFPFEPNEFDIYFYWYGDGENDTPEETLTLLGSVPCNDSATFFIPAGALECFEDCSDGTFHAFITELPIEGIDVSFQANVTDCDEDGELLLEEFDLDRPSGWDCNVENTFNAPLLTLSKVCDPEDPDPEGAASPTFTITIDDVNSDSGFAYSGVECGDEFTVTLPPGLFVVDESADGFDTEVGTGDSDDCPILQAELGGEYTCEVTNTEVEPATLTINKVCDPVDAAGVFTVTVTRLPVEDLPLEADLECVENPATVDAHPSAVFELDPGTYVIAEGAEGFDADIDCDQNGAVVVLEAGDNVVCTVTNTEVVAPIDDTTIALSKLCEGDDFTDASFEVTGVTEGDIPIECGDELDPEVVEPGDYDIGEQIIGADAAGFTTTITCVINGVVDDGDIELAEGDDAVCVIINTFDDPEIPGPPPEDPGDDDSDGDGDNTNNNNNNNDNNNDNTNVNTNIIDIPIDITNTTENALNNDNINDNNNENTNTQEQSNEQNQTNDNNQTTTVNSSPSVVIDFGE